MPVPSIDGVHYRVRLKWLIRGQECFNVMHFRSAGSQDLIDDLLVPILACASTHLIPVLSENITLIGADAQNVDGSVAQFADNPISSDNVGELTGGDAPTGTSALFIVRTLHPGRNGQGRFFVPGIDEESLDGSTLDATFLAAAVAFVACVAASFFVGDPPAATQFVLTLFSRTDNAFYDVTSITPKPTASFLRSRKFGT